MSSDDYFFDQLRPPPPSAPPGTPVASIIFWTLITVLIRNVTRRAAAAFNAVKPPMVPAPIAALGLSWPCGIEDVKRAFRRQALRAHPDAGGSDEAFRALVENYRLALIAVGAV